MEPKLGHGATKRRSALGFQSAGLYFLAAQALASPVSAKTEGDCSAEGASRGRVASINERLELKLAGGKELKIAGIDPPRPTPDDPDLDVKIRDRLSDWLAGREILYRPIAQREDRWGRLPAFVFVPAGEPGGAPLPVAEALLDAGLARFEPNAAARQCRASLLTLESGARAAALGLWADPYYAVIPAINREPFPDKAGTFVVVEGRVASVESGAFRSTLFFGPRRGWHFSVTIPRRNIKTFEAAGMDLAGLAGHTLRVRGLLETRFGPQIEISGPDEIEVVAEDQGGASAGPAPGRR